MTMSTSWPAATPASDGEPEAAAASVVDDAAFVPPAAIRAGHQPGGPRYGDDVWDISAFVPRTAQMTRIDFTTIADPGHARTVQEYLHSRLNRGIPANQLSGTARPMKLTSLYQEFTEVRLILRELAVAGAALLADVTPRHLEQILTGWKPAPTPRQRKSGRSSTSPRTGRSSPTGSGSLPGRAVPLTRSPDGASRGRTPRPGSRRK
jgi:hypothetical protein